MRNVLLDPARCGYVPTNIRTLIGNDAKIQNILAELDWLITQAQNDSEATIFFYFSGHGWKSKNDPPRYYIIPNDCNWDDIDTSAIRADILSDKLNQILASRLVVLLDACHSGGATKEEQVLPSGFSKSPIPPIVLFERLKSGSGRIVISSSRENERSFIKAPDYDCSIFTHHLLLALSGEAHTYNPEQIGIIDLYSYLAATVSVTAEKQIDYLTGKPAQQHPIMDGSKTDNFPIALLLGGKSVSDISRGRREAKLTPEQIERLKQRRKELQKHLNTYTEQREAMEEDLTLNQDGQQRVILKKRIQKVEENIHKLEKDINFIDAQIE